jgi:hypothetical protein
MSLMNMLPHMARRKLQLDGAETLLTLTNNPSLMADDNKPTDSVPTKAAEKPTSTADADLTKYKVRCFLKGVLETKKMKPTLLWTKTAADIVHQVMKKLVDLCVEGGKVLDICMEGDKLIEQGTSAVYNKSVKGVKVTKGMCNSPFILL